MSDFNGNERRSSSYIMDIAARAADVAVEKMLTRLGFDLANPIAMQADVANLRAARARESDPETMKDRSWLRETRVRCEVMREQAISMAWRAVVVFCLAGAVLGGWMIAHKEPSPDLIGKVLGSAEGVPDAPPSGS